LRFQDKEVDEQKTKISVLEKEHKTLVERTRQLSDQCDQKSLAVSATSQKLDSVERDIVVVRQTIHSLDVDINDAERSNDRAIEYQKQLLRQKDQEIVKSQDTSYLLRELEQRCKDADLQIDHLRKDLENVRYSNDALLDRNHDLKLELESLNQHSELLTS
jgi:chromosome segregation ATPase